jgi:pimeloyl-ACP methyl ester carboxylesterase
MFIPTAVNFGRGSVFVLAVTLIGATLVGCAGSGTGVPAGSMAFVAPVQVAAGARGEGGGAGRQGVASGAQHTVGWEQQGAAPQGPLLVVISFGFGCSGTGSGNGLQELGAAIRQAHPDFKVITRGWNDNDDVERTIAEHRGPVAMVGHSFGGSQSLDFAARAGRAVEWVVLLDPVPTHDWAFRHDGKYFEVPASVGRAICFYRPPGIWPLSYPIVNPQTPSDNRMRELGHAEIPATAEVRKCVLELCDQQAAAAARRRGAMNVAAVGMNP